MYDISPEILLAAALVKYGAGVKVSPAFFAGDGYVRVGIQLNDPETGEEGASFGANFWYKEGVFR